MDQSIMKSDNKNLQEELDAAKATIEEQREMLDELREKKADELD